MVLADDFAAIDDRFLPDELFLYRGIDFAKCENGVNRVFPEQFGIGSANIVEDIYRCPA